MSITDEKLMDYVDGRLNEKEATDVEEAIKSDPELKQKAEDLKIGLEFAEMGHMHRVMNAPDPTKRSVRRKAVAEKRSGFWSLIFSAPSRAIPAIAACLLVAFLGGTQYTGMMVADVTDTQERNIQLAELESEVETLKIDLELLAIENKELASTIIDVKKFAAARDLTEETAPPHYTELAVLDRPDIKFRDAAGKKHNRQKWWVTEKFALSVLAGKMGIQMEFVPYNGSVKKGDQIVFNLQVFNKSNVSVELHEEGNEPYSILDSIPAEPGKIISTRPLKTVYSESVQKLVLIVVTDGKEHKAEFLYNIEK